MGKAIMARGGGFPRRVHRRRQRLGRAALRLARHRRRQLDLAGQRPRDPRHPGLSRLHEEPLRQRRGERHRTALFDLTNGWNGKPAVGEHVFVVTHQAPTDWEHAGTAPFTFVDDVEKGIAATREFAGDRDVDVAGGQIGSQALELGLIDQVVVNFVPVVFGSGRPFFATGGLAEPLRLENPTTIVQGDRVTHLVYDVSSLMTQHLGRGGG
jgi:dihydrofolate reductase